MAAQRVDLKIKKSKLLSVLLCIGCFFTASSLRVGLFSNALLRGFSPLLYLSMFFLAAVCGKQNPSSGLSDTKLKNDTWLILIVTLFVIALTFFTGFLSEKMTLLFSILVPMFFLAFRFRKESDFESFFETWVSFSRFSIVVIAIMSIVDSLSNYSITSFFADYTKIVSFYNQLRQHRCVSYIGHPLFTCEILLAHYLLSSLYYERRRQKQPVVDFIFPLIGIVLARGRIAFLLICFSFILLNLRRKRAVRVVLAILLFAVLYEFGFFDAIIQKFGYSFRNDIRNESFRLLFFNNTNRFYWFKGQRKGILDEVSFLSAALEYPLLRWAFLLGIIPSIMLAMVYFVLPIIACIKAKDKHVLVAMIALAIDVNAYSSLGDAGMKQAFYCVVVCIILNAAEALNERKAPSLDETDQTSEVIKG